MDSLMKLTCPAPAKLNLFLHVVGRRPGGMTRCAQASGAGMPPPRLLPQSAGSAITSDLASVVGSPSRMASSSNSNVSEADGYHLLQTLFRFIDLHDTLHFSLREDGVVRRTNAVDGVAEEQDLCVRAARLLQSDTGCGLGVDITVEKRIPMGGGLGGGSSDAATTLIALNRLWSLGLSRARLMRLGLRLGADVPVFVFGENAFAEGVGDELQAYPLAEAWYVVLFPPVHVPTAQIFAHPELTRDTVSITMRALLERQTGSGQQLRNDLQPVVCGLYPEVARYLARLGKYGNAMMTGSGACVFAEFASRSQAEAVLRELPHDIRGVVAQGLARHPLHDWVPD
jgi:4-diphosphocytidyl-2-C-methyl-D-erythritol kinase